MTARDVEFSFELDKKAVESIAGSDRITEALVVLAQVGEASAKRHAPVDTGHLRRSITHEIVSPGENDQHAIVGTNVVYAVFQEFGTRFHAAHPFLRPAMSDIEEFVRQL